MNNTTLGRLQRVDLRTVWSSESGDFTPWLAQEETLALLGDTIGLELDLDSTEKFVGPFRADIVCKDTITNSWVLIENQLERTDHAHLGQLLTYAAGLSAVTIVWIAEKFTSEHRAALDWLNEATDESINFFGLEIELWQIGISPVAPKFNIISQPNDWIKTVAAVRQVQQAGEISETKQLQYEYWASFKSFLEEHHSIVTPQSPLPQHWANFSIGRSYFTLSATVNTRDKVVGVGMIIAGADAKAFYHLLAQDKDAIEAQIGEKLAWRELPTKKSSDIQLSLSGLDPLNKKQWTQQHQWLRDKLEAFYRCFAPRVKRLNAADYIDDEITDEV